MTTTEVAIYWTPALKNIFDRNIFDEDYHWCCNKLEVALGEKLYSQWEKRPYFTREYLTEDQKRKLLLLAGPHGKTIYKAMLAKRGQNVLPLRPVAP